MWSKADKGSQSQRLLMDGIYAKSFAWPFARAATDKCSFFVHFKKLGIVVIVLSFCNPYAISGDWERLSLVISIIYFIFMLRILQRTTGNGVKGSTMIRQHLPWVCHVWLALKGRGQLFNQFSWGCRAVTSLWAFFSHQSKHKPLYTDYYKSNFPLFALLGEYAWKVNADFDESTVPCH